MSEAKTKSKAENIRELERLQAMFKRLPPGKQRAARDHMQKRINELAAAIAGRAQGRERVSSIKVLRLILSTFLVAALAVGIGFFSVNYLAQK